MKAFRYRGDDTGLVLYTVDKGYRQRPEHCPKHYIPMVQVGFPEICRWIDPEKLEEITLHKDYVHESTQS